MKELEKYKITLDFSIRKALKKLDDGGISFIVCTMKMMSWLVLQQMVIFDVLFMVELRLRNVEKLINREFLYVNKNFDLWEVQNIFHDTIVERILFWKMGN